MNTKKQNALKLERMKIDLCVVGGGLAGICAAIVAAREGIRVVLIQDRPVLGGNASSEVRLWVLGATSHMGNNNRWALEGGVIQEILCENLWRNREGNSLVMDTILLEKVTNESNIRLLLNTAVNDVEKSDPDTISAVHAFCSQNSTRYRVEAPLFVDASGDGILGFLSGAAFRIGVESRDELDEPYAPEQPSQDLLGHSIYFMSKDVGYSVPYVAPSFALDMDTIRSVHKFRGFDAKTQGCQFWWIEYGGHLDTVHEAETIKWELWRAVYGVWNYIKNSGNYPEADTMTLEWVGPIPGKRESRRFEGDVMLRQQDVVQQTRWPDAVSFGGWAVDHHPVEGLFSAEQSCTQWHAKGVYEIPYRALYSRNISNLFLAGRIISASHIAFGTTRVMGTCAHSAQAVGVAAAHCLKDALLPRDLNKSQRMQHLQRDLIRRGQYIPCAMIEDEEDLAQTAIVTTSSEFLFESLPESDEFQVLDYSRAIMLPVKRGQMPAVTIWVRAEKATTLVVKLLLSEKPNNHSPEVQLAELSIELEAGELQAVVLPFEAEIAYPCYAYVCLMQNLDVCVQLSDLRVTGVLSVAARYNEAVAKSNRQLPPAGSGFDEIEFWIPERRPKGKNFRLAINPALSCYCVENVTSSYARPVASPNAWVADPKDSSPTITLSWEAPQMVQRIVLVFDGDYDHPMESALLGHPERVTPFCVKHYQLINHAGEIVFEASGVYQPRAEILLDRPIVTQSLGLRILETWGAPAAVFSVQVFAA